jgi:AraC family transcriptional regulator
MTAISENLYPAGSVLPLHAHDESFLSLALAGGYAERHASRTVEYIPGAMSFHPPHEEHSVHVGTRDLYCLNVEIGAPYMARLHDAGAKVVPFHVVDGGPMVWLATRLHNEIAAPSAESPLIVEGLLLEILGSVARIHGPEHDRHAPRWLATVEELLRTELQQRLTIDELARRVGLHPVHLSRTWRRFRRCSIGESMQSARIEEACRRMALGRASLQELALELGFADQTHFTRVFKRCTGMTPGAYRAQFRTVPPLT